MQITQKERRPEMSILTVRAVTGACPDLIAALVELHQQAFPAHLQSAEPQRYFAEALGDERNLNIVMHDQAGTVIGYLLGIPQSQTFEELRAWDPAMQDDPERMYLEMIQVLPGQRGSKRGLCLIQAACAEAEKRNIFRLSMHARTTTGWNQYLHRIFAEIRFLRRIENWYGFGEPFDYLEATTTLSPEETAGQQRLVEAAVVAM
jgi:ribosomal protein S18 acetylase RimI-like enzyme